MGIFGNIGNNISNTLGIGGSSTPPPTPPPPGIIPGGTGNANPPTTLGVSNTAGGTVQRSIDELTNEQLEDLLDLFVDVELIAVTEGFGILNGVGNRGKILDLEVKTRSGDQLNYQVHRTNPNDPLVLEMNGMFFIPEVPNRPTGTRTTGPKHVDKYYFVGYSLEDALDNFGNDTIKIPSGKVGMDIINLELYDRENPIPEVPQLKNAEFFLQLPQESTNLQTAGDELRIKNSEEAYSGPWHTEWAGEEREVDLPFGVGKIKVPIGPKTLKAYTGASPELQNNTDPKSFFDKIKSGVFNTPSQVREQVEQLQTGGKRLQEELEIFDSSEIYDLESVEPLKVSFDAINMSDYWSNDGKIKLHINGGTEPYKILWKFSDPDKSDKVISMTDLDDQQTVSGLQCGYYTAMIEDSTTLTEVNDTRYVVPSLAKSEEPTDTSKEWESTLEVVQSKQPEYDLTTNGWFFYLMNIPYQGKWHWGTVPSATAVRTRVKALKNAIARNKVLESQGKKTLPLPVFNDQEMDSPTSGLPGPFGNNNRTGTNTGPFGLTSPQEGLELVPIPGASPKDIPYAILEFQQQVIKNFEQISAKLQLADTSRQEGNSTNIESFDQNLDELQYWAPIFKRAMQLLDRSFPVILDISDSLLSPEREDGLSRVQTLNSFEGFQLRSTFRERNVKIIPIKNSQIEIEKFKTKSIRTTIYQPDPMLKDVSDTAEVEVSDDIVDYLYEEYNEYDNGREEVVESMENAVKEASNNQKILKLIEKELEKQINGEESSGNQLLQKTMRELEDELNKTDPQYPPAEDPSIKLYSKLGEELPAKELEDKLLRKILGGPLPEDYDGRTDLSRTDGSLVPFEERVIKRNRSGLIVSEEETEEKPRLDVVLEDEMIRIPVFRNIVDTSFKSIQLPFVKEDEVDRLQREIDKLEKENSDLLGDKTGLLNDKSQMNRKLESNKEQLSLLEQRLDTINDQLNVTPRDGTFFHIPIKKGNTKESMDFWYIDGGKRRRIQNYCMLQCLMSQRNIPLTAMEVIEPSEIAKMERGTDVSIAEASGFWKVRGAITLNLYVPDAVLQGGKIHPKLLRHVDMDDVPLENVIDWQWAISDRYIKGTWGKYKDKIPQDREEKHRKFLAISSVYWAGIQATKGAFNASFDVGLGPLTIK